jgi:hypothetical protein
MGMELTVKRNGDDSADIEIPGGCALCAGPLAMRVSRRGAVSVCVACRWVARPQVEFGPTGLQVAFNPSALA